MGVEAGQLAFLALASRRGVDFGNALTIGRQFVFIRDGEVVRDAMREAGVHISLPDARALLNNGDGYSEGLLAWLGAKHVDSVDNSDFEKATIIHDMNRPLPEQYKRQYSVVIDSGTLEHVFNFPVALKSSLEAVRVGGHYVAMTPGTNYGGHGLYQFTPELYYRALSPSNGFRVCTMLWKADSPGSRWHSVSDPEIVKHRVQRWSPVPVLLYIVAKRESDCDIFANPVQQSDYVEAWNVHESVKQGATVSPYVVSEARISEGLRRRLPYSVVRSLRNSRWIFRVAPLYSGKGDFKRVALGDVQFA